MQDLLVGPSAALSNGNIADGRIKWRCPFWKDEEFEEPTGESGQGCSDLNGRLPNLRINCGKASLLQKNFGALMILYSEIGGMC